MSYDTHTIPLDLTQELHLAQLFTAFVKTYLVSRQLRV